MRITVRSGRLGQARDGLQVVAAIAQRATARADKDWQRADEIRVQLDSMGIAVMVRADGVDWRIRLS